MTPRQTGASNVKNRNRLLTCCAIALLLAPLFPARGGTAGPDAYGYVGRDTVAYSFTDIASTGVAVLSGADDDRALVDLGFAFRFYGRSYTRVCISSNGFLSFGFTTAAECSLDFVNLDLTSIAPAGNPPVIAAFWTDLTFAPSGAGAVHYQVLGTPGARRFVVQWTSAFPLNSPEAVTFQAILHEGTGRILLQYRDVEAGGGARPSKGGTATVGIRDTAGQENGRALQWSYNAPALRNQMALEFAAMGRAPVDLGKAGPHDWALLCLGQAVMSGQTSIPGPSANVGIAAGKSMVASGTTIIGGKLYLGTGARLTKSGTLDIAGGTVQGANADELLAQAVADANAASQSAAGQMATIAGYSSVNLPSRSLTIAGGAGANVLNLSDLVLANGVLTLDAPAGATFLVNVSGRFVMTGSSEIRLAGGVTPSSVLYNVKGTGSGVTLASGRVAGVLLAPQRSVQLSSAFTGEVIAGATTISGTTRIQNE